MGGFISGREEGHADGGAGVVFYDNHRDLFCSADLRIVVLKIRNSR
jgi:hypothetical protein